MVRCIILLFVALGAFAQGRAGIVAFRRLAIPDDVPAHLCSAIAQDARGFLWFGTQGGLVRYDGTELRVFRTNPYDPSTLAGNYVRALLPSRDGRLWVGTFSGALSVFDPKTETFTRFQVAYDRVEGLAEDAQGNIWIATPAGLDRLDPKSGEIAHLSDERARGLLVDRRGNVWAGTRAGLRLWRNGRLELRGLQGENVIRLYEDRRGQVWIGTEEHGAAVLLRDGTLRRLAPGGAGLSHYWVYGFAEGPGEEMWIATFGGGVDIVDARTLAVIDRLRHDATLPDTIGADRVGAVFRDRAGVMWVGTWGEGLARHDPHTRAFRALRFSPNRPDGLTHASAVRALEMRDGTIWVGTNGNGIDILDASLRRIGAHRPSPDSLSDGAITCLAQAADGTIWVATLNAAQGMVRVDPRTLATRVFRRWPGAAKASPAIEAITFTNDGTLWAGSDNGLYAFDPRTESAVRIAKEDELPENWVPDLLVARDGRLWIGTAGGVAVLTQWDGKRARFDVVTTRAAEALIEDADGYVWIGPRLRLDQRTHELRDFGPADGVAFRGFFIASRARMRDGRLLFGSPEGLLVVDPRAVAPPRTGAPIVATALQVEGRTRSGASVLRSLTLSPSQRSFALDVAALDFAAARRTYRYRLDGLDTRWLTTQRTIHYSRLPPGHYVLRVTVGTARELRLPVVVEPAMYQTLWFRALAALFVLALLYVAYRLRVRQLRARGRVLEQLVAARTRQLETAYAQIEEASLTDPLTGLRNRRYLEQSIGGDLELARRGHGDLVVLLVDLDHFKSVNDTHGHAAGDAVLAQLAALLQRTFRTSDAIVRWGGEEFLIVNRFVDRAAAPELAEKLRAAVAAHPFELPDGTTIHRTCSIGFAAWPSGDATFEQVIADADAALYAAKRGGRNACVGADAYTAR